MDEPIEYKDYVVSFTVPMTPETSVLLLQQARRDEQWREYLNTDLFGPQIFLARP